MSVRLYDNFDLAFPPFNRRRSDYTRANIYFSTVTQAFNQHPHYWWFANVDSHRNRSFSYDRSFEDLLPRHRLTAMIKRCLYFLHIWLRKILSIPSQVDITDRHQVGEDNTFSFSWAICSHNQLAFILPKTKSTVRYRQSFSGLASVRHWIFPQEWVLQLPR